MTALVGREDDCRRIESLLAAGRRLVTISGPPGAGKTTLARAVLARAPVRGLFCDLGAARTESDLALALLRALGVDATGEGGLDRARIARILGTERRLLVLDDFEQLVAPASAAVGHWIAACPELTFVVTSRERLQLDAEIVHPVGPLSLPARDGDDAALRRSEAVALFVERARAVRPDWEPVGDELRAAADVVHELDGLPLAIELAASRMGVLGVRALHQMLGRRFEVLKSGRRDGPARHRTLEQAIAWSFDLLAPDARAAIDAIGAFEGGFDLAAAEAVLAPGAGVSVALDRVQALFDASLLRHVPTSDGTARWAPWASVAELARATVARDALAAAIARHEDHYLGRGADLARRAEQGSIEALRALARDEDNLVAVVRRALERGDRRAAALALLALDPLRAVSGPLDRHADELDAVLSTPGGLQASLRSRALGARGRARCLLARTQDAERDLREALGIAGDDAAALRDLGILLRQRGLMDESEILLAASLAKTVDGAARGRIEGQLGILHKERGDLRSARARYERAIGLLRDAGDTRAHARVLCDLGALEQEEGRWDRARACFDSALALLAPIGDRRLEAIAHSDRGLLALEIGRAEEAERELAASVARLRAVGDRRYAALMESARAAALAMLDRIQEASEAIEPAITTLASSRDVLFAGAARIHRGHLWIARARRDALAGADPSSAMDEAERCLTIAREIDPEREVALGSLSDDIRTAERALRAAIARARDDQDALVVGPEGAWIRPAGSREIVDLSKRPALRGLVAALASGAPRSADELITAGWPGERVQARAARNRLSVALTTLRQLGLRDSLVRAGEGWTLAGRVVRSTGPRD